MDIIANPGARAPVAIRILSARALCVFVRIIEQEPGFAHDFRWIDSNQFGRRSLNTSGRSVLSRSTGSVSITTGLAPARRLSRKSEDRRGPSDRLMERSRAVARERHSP